MRASSGGAARLVWLVSIVVTGGLTVAYFALPGHHLQLWTPLGLVAVLCTLAGIRLQRPTRPLAWYLLAGAELCFIAGDTTFNVLTDVLHQQNPFPSVADGFYLLMYPVWAAALLLLVRARSVSKDRASLLDALIIATGLGLLSWLYLVLPNYNADGLSPFSRAVSVAYPLGDVLVLTMLARLVTGGGLRVRSVQLLVLGAVALLVSDVAYGLQQLSGSWALGGPTDAGWAVFYIAYGAAALHPSSRRVNEPVAHRSAQIGRWRLLMLASVSLIAPAVLLLEALHGTVRHGVTIAVFSAVLYLLVIARLSGIVAVHRRSVERERVLRASGESLVAAQGLPDVYAAALAGVQALTPGSGSVTAGIYLVQHGGLLRVAGSHPILGDDSDALLWDPAQPGGYLGERGTLSVSALRYEKDLRGMLVLRSQQPMSLDVHLAVSTLASQVALALESATLAGDLRKRENEAHFRALIQNASDVIVVVDEHGQISYGTPSLGRALADDVANLIGTPLAALLHPGDVGDLKAALASAHVTAAKPRPLADWRLQDGRGGYLAFEVLFSNLLGDDSVSGVVLTMRDVSDRRALEEQLKHQAFHDGLTGLANRVLFGDRAAHALGRGQRHDTLLAMVMVDLDDFKGVNDSRGHGAGDELLQEVARRLEANLRAGDTAARFGGDEFALLIEDVPDAAEAEALAGRVLRAFDRPFLLHGEPVRVHASAGLVLAGADTAAFTLPELLRCADLALYAAKERGKGQVVRYYDDLHARMLDRLARRADLQRAVEAGEFFLHYQPIVTLADGRVRGAEALLRWRHPQRGLVSPLEFIELAEDTGLIVELGRWALDEACRQARAWADHASGGIRVSVNVSGRQLHEAGFVDEVAATLARHQLPPSLLVLELTETVLVVDGSGVPERIAALKELGLQIAIDDFGIGYSSLAYLQHFPIDILKVDKSFVDELGSDDGGGGVLARAVISLARSLGLDVVAEGVEHPAQRAELVTLGCRLGQGFLFSTPVAAEQLSLLVGRDQPLGPPGSPPEPEPQPPGPPQPEPDPEPVTVPAQSAGFEPDPSPATTCL